MSTNGGSLFCSLFDQVFNDIISKKFEIALFSLICPFVMIENQINQSWFVHDSICPLRVKLFLLVNCLNKE